MTDEEMEIYCKLVNEQFANWIKKINIMEYTLKDLLMEVFFAGYDCGRVQNQNKIKGVQND